jgi:hypothetical protein
MLTPDEFFISHLPSGKSVKLSDGKKYESDSCNWISSVDPNDDLTKTPPPTHICYLTEATRNFSNSITTP